MPEYYIEIKFSTDDEDALENLVKIIETAAPYMVDNVQVLWDPIVYDNG